MAAGVCVATALLITAGQSALVRPGDPRINIRWRPGVSEPQRAANERQLNLAPVEPLGDDTWRYQLNDSSRANIEAVVRHPDVEDTHHVDRADFEVTRDVPRGDSRLGPLGERWPAAAYLVVGYGPPLLGLLALFFGLYAARPDVVHAAGRGVGAALTYGIPAITPRTLAIFRLVLGLIVAYYVLDLPFPDKRVPPDPYRINVPLANVAPVFWLAERPALVRAVQDVATAALAIFAVGIVPRAAYAVAMAGVTAWLMALTLRGGMHPYGVLLLPLLALLAVPWGDAPPIHHFFGGRSVPTAPSKRYGYAPWMLCFALGVALAGAAWAKMSEGPGWVTNGTVRYHFVTDIDYATVDWGLRVATMPRLAVAMSAAAVLVEATMIVAAFVRPPLLRLVFGLSAAGLLTGFYLFQGLLWHAWWILLLGFLPWPWLDRKDTASRPAIPPLRSTISRAQLLCVIGLVAQQVITSSAEIELEPFGSQYDMYSKTHASPADYDAENPGTVRRIYGIEENDRRRDLTDCAMRIGGPMSEALIDPTLPVPERAPEVVACQPSDEPPPRGFVVVEDQCRFHWEQGHFYCLYRDRLIATLPATE